MKVLVLGAGVVGTATAYYLHKAGHEVVVVDRASGAGQETSFANAGGVCPSFAGPWAAPGMPLKVLRWLFARHAPLSFSPRLSLRQWRWLAAFIGNCTPERFARNKAHMQRSAHYSKACLVALREETGIAYDHGTGGVLQIFRTREELDAAQQSAKVLRSFNIAHRLVGAKDAIEIEPALGHSTVALAGAGGFAQEPGCRFSVRHRSSRFDDGRQFRQRRRDRARNLDRRPLCRRAGQ